MTAKTMTAKTATPELAARPTIQEILELQGLPPVRSREIGGVTWRYSVAGEGPRSLLVFPGAAGGADVSLRLLPALEGYRILTLTYPVVHTLDVLMAGVEEILTAEGMEQIDVFGGSFGGMVAQCFVRHAPQRVRRLILQGTGVRTPSRADSNERFLRLVRFVPMGVFHALLRLVIRRMLRKMPRDERGFWVTYYDGEIRGLGKDDLVSRYRLSIDFDRNMELAAEDLADRSIPVLLLEGADDKIAGSDQREQLKALYPEARIHTFEGVGHGMSLLRPEEWSRAIAGFLKGS